MKGKRFSILIVVIVIVSVIVFLQWLNGNRNHTIDGSNREAILSTIQPTIDNLFLGMKAEDFSIFSRDFGQKMQKQFDANSFMTLTKSFSNKGRFQKTQLTKLEILNGYYVVTYTLYFEKGTAALKVILPTKSPYTVEGISTKY